MNTRTKNSQQLVYLKVPPLLLLPILLKHHLYVIKSSFTALVVSRHAVCSSCDTGQGWRGRVEGGSLGRPNLNDSSTINLCHMAVYENPIGLEKLKEMEFAPMIASGEPRANQIKNIFRLSL